MGGVCRPTWRHLGAFHLAPAVDIAAIIVLAIGPSILRTRLNLPHLQQTPDVGELIVAADGPDAGVVPNRWREGTLPLAPEALPLSGMLEPADVLVFHTHICIWTSNVCCLLADATGGSILGFTDQNSPTSPVPWDASICTLNRATIHLRPAPPGAGRGPRDR